MSSEFHYVSAPGTPLHSLRLLLKNLEQVRDWLRAAPHHATVEGEFLAQLLECADILEQTCAGAAEMEMGADGFDNKETSRRYAEVQQHILAAAQEISDACRALAR